MKKFLLFSICIQFCLGIVASPQKGSDYRRNSLCTFFVTDVGKIDQDAMSNAAFACQNYKVSSKFDSHNIGLDRTIQVRNIQLKGKNKPKQNIIERLGRAVTAAQGVDYDKELARIQSNTTPNLQEKLEEDALIEELPKRFAQFLEDHKVANILLAKWFNASSKKVDGSYYNMELIQARGVYGASELEKLRAAESVRGRAILADAGMELLSHTYVTFTYFDYTTSQENAEQSQKFGTKLFGNSSYLGGMVKKVTDDKKNNYSGYWVRATTYLFRLKWNQSLEDLFINKYYNEPVSVLLNSDDFQMEYIGYQSSPTISYEERTGVGASGNARMAGEATIRAIDASLGYLQKKFEDFRVKTPLIDVNESEISAFIGTKEGIEPTSAFEVLERIYNEKKNRYNYKRVSTLKIDKKRPIFDNEYILGQEEEPVGKTFLKGDHSKIAPGMLIRQIK